MVVRTNEPSVRLRHLLDECRELPDLRVAPPSLEEVYLDLVGSAEMASA
jgi:hypothetical protein